MSLQQKDHCFTSLIAKLSFCLELASSPCVWGGGWGDPGTPIKVNQTIGV